MGGVTVIGAGLSGPPGRVPLAPGTAVEVRNRFDGRWSSGFEVAAEEPGGYRIVRLSDASELPVLLGRDEVRRARRRQDLWWR